MHGLSHVVRAQHCSEAAVHAGLDTVGGRLLGCDQSKNVEVGSTELNTMRQVICSRWVG